MLDPDLVHGSVTPGEALAPVFRVEEPLSGLQARFCDQARAYRDAGRTAGTRRVYESAFALFRTWCQQHQASPFAR